MTAFFAALATFAYERIWLSKKSTILGLAVSAGVEVVSYFAIGTGPSGTPPWVHIIAGLILAPLLAWKDKEVKSGAIIDLPPPRGFARLGTLAFLVLISLGVGCASVFGATGKRDVIDCGKQELREAAAELAPQASFALTSGGLDWKAALGVLEQHAGEAAVCAVAVLIKDFEAAHAIEAAPVYSIAEECAGGDCSPGPVEIHELAIERGREYLADKPVPMQSFAP